jgi:hypothetical protein
VSEENEMENEMRSGVPNVALVVLALCGMLMAGSVRAADAVDCDRTCLQGFVDQYLKALGARDLKALPVTSAVRFTENGQELKLGEGLWVTVSGIGSYKFYMADPQTRQIGFFGTIREAGDPEVFFLRLKLDNRRISEVETIVARGSGLGRGKPGAIQLEERGLAPVMTAPLSPAERLPRQRLVQIANGYFESMEQGSSKPAPFYEKCTRIENGGQSAGNLSAVNTHATGINMGALNCAQQFDTGFSKGFSFVPLRRFPVVDEERGLVLSVVALQHPGRAKTMHLSDGEERPIGSAFLKPYQFTMAEAFKIKDGKIHQVEAVLLPAPYGMKSGWD